MKLRELLDYFEDEQLIMIQLNGLSSQISKKEKISEEWIENKVKNIETEISKGYKGYFINQPDKPFVKIEIE